jgi:hypothetical protein
MSDTDERDCLIGELLGDVSSKPSRVIRTEPVCRYGDVLPRTAEVLTTLLIKAGYGWLAKQVPDLMIFDRCSCQAPECASFYTQPEPEGRYGPTHWGFMLPSPGGLMVFDVLGDTIAFVEILGFHLATEETRTNWPKLGPGWISQMRDSAEAPRT